MADDGELNLDELLSGNYELPPDNRYIADPKQGVAFIASMLGRSEEKEENSSLAQFRKGIEDIFHKFREFSLPDELSLYHRFQTLCEKLKIIHKFSRLSDKTIVGFGGKFSAGKSSFINAISGINDILPEAQEATTSIPTYIIKSKQKNLTANNIFGDTWSLSQEALEAMTHEFRRIYGINCAPFIDSIIVETPAYALDSRIALLDTPGYTKADDNANSRLVLSDRIRAYEQLRVTDYLIWLIDMDNDPLTQNDIDFIDSLDIKSKILIVFNKADLKPPSVRKEILDKAQEDVKLMSTPVFGIAAYSSKKREEYTEHVIEDFFREVAESKIHNNDLLQQFRENTDLLHQSLTFTYCQHEKISADLLQFIMKAKNPQTLKSIAKLWRNENIESAKLNSLIQDFDKNIHVLEGSLQNLLGKRE